MESTITYKISYRGGSIVIELIIVQKSGVASFQLPERVHDHEFYLFIHFGRKVKSKGHFSPMLFIYEEIMTMENYE